MREIAAASDFDFVASEPAPAKPARATRKSRAQKTAAPNWLSRVWTWRTPLFGGFAFVALLAAIGVNAMFLQHGRHPAPLMGSVLRIEPPKAEPAPPAAAAHAHAPAPALAPVARAEARPAPSALDEVLAGAAPAPAPKPVAVKPAKPVVAAPVPSAKPAAPPVAKNLAAPAAKTAPAPKIVAPVAKNVSPVAKNVATAAPTAKPAGKPDSVGAPMDKAAAPAPDKTVTSVQTALNKLGAHVPASGKLDDATRKAVQKFQRDNGLPVTGELTAKQRRFLALQAGLPE